MTQTITFDFRGIGFVADCEYEEGEPMRYDHLSIKPDGDDADFLSWFQSVPEWPQIDQRIDAAWNEWVSSREACGFDDVMDATRAREEDADIQYQDRKMGYDLEAAEIDRQKAEAEAAPENL